MGKNKASDFLNMAYQERMNAYFNPYEYNLESNIDWEVNRDILVCKSKRQEVKLKKNNK